MFLTANFKSEGSQDGKMVKEAFIEAAGSLFRNLPEILSLIKVLQLLKNTVTQHSKAMAEDLTKQL